MHTLCLLDIKVKEPDFEKMARGKVSFLPPRYMSVSDPILSYPFHVLALLAAPFFFVSSTLRTIVLLVRK